ncbi:protein transport protein Sec61 subunit gamma [Coregonus clupeaformis]|uniref:Protein transport protein Sec61 subunit gamma n=1 Tax=Coregonus suidteri TaxID=861788 RepID=A0AAN8QUW3_9TELE|nr:protein transport protein Sec61 subunit gamma [Coregonus clupeaformis]
MRIFLRSRRHLLEHTWPLHRAVTKIGIQKRTPDQNLSNMDQVMQFVEPSRQFVKDSIRLVKRCTKPDRKEFSKIAMATAIGFAIMGFIGFFVKLIHIPINNIIVGG